jgi:hypothetical protein
VGRNHHPEESSYSSCCTRSVAGADVAASPPLRVEPRLRLASPLPPSRRREGSFPDPEHEFLTPISDGLSVEERLGLGWETISGRGETNASFLVGRYLNPGWGTPVGRAAFPAGVGLTEQGLKGWLGGCPSRMAPNL